MMELSPAKNDGNFALCVTCIDVDAVSRHFFFGDTPSPYAVSRDFFFMDTPSPNKSKTKKPTPPPPPPPNNNNKKNPKKPNSLFLKLT
jgi:hypothetical protein